MSLDTPEDFAQLGEHLQQIDPVFQEFLKAHEYRDNTGTLGRYPHRSAVQESEIQRKIDLYMENNRSTGRPYEEFESSVPYSLWAGAWVDDVGQRYSDGGEMIFERLPFDQIAPKLAAYLTQAAAFLAPYTKEQLIAECKPFSLG
ncbi:hypothetical protein [Aeoliella mucimassa]|uniref:Uncharacterized protein n=1 Tax=Aeoliella mucimassa TaxID=2527972 RepID=A0A518ASM4_9BACT|nr:hypothetical protein [Aeoliella mucimassa]QDU57728.1 hypothetical protein Pan181_39500 [Aeoliella mucimassa]